MGFYDDPKNVDSYIKMCEEYDGSNLYEILKKNLDVGKSVLELGSGPGFDLPFLMKHFQVTGSDLSNEFISRCKKQFPEIEFLKLDVKDIAVEKKYNCIYSNKVLHHLTEDELSLSLAQQVKVLTKDGIIAHSFWLGEESQQMHGLLFTYYREKRLLNIISEYYSIISTMRYQEIEKGDSLFIVAQKK